MRAQQKMPRRCANTHGAPVNYEELIGMSKPTCSIEGCGRTDRIVRGWCALHYQRWQSTGDPESPRRVASSPEESIAMRTRREGDCLVWTGALYPNGYGMISTKGKNTRVHRYAWERENGPIPDGLVIDHLCRNRKCVSPDHLEVVTQAENVRRGEAGHHMRQKSKAIDSCPRGHAYTPENTRINRAGARVCRTCVRSSSMARPRTKECPSCGQERHYSSMARHIRTMHAEED